MIISFHVPVTGINTLLSKKSAWKITDLWTENLLDPVLNCTECEVNLPESSGVARNGPSRARPDHSKIKLSL